MPLLCGCRISRGILFDIPSRCLLFSILLGLLFIIFLRSLIQVTIKWHYWWHGVDWTWLAPLINSESIRCPDASTCVTLQCFYLILLSDQMPQQNICYFCVRKREKFYFLEIGSTWTWFIAIIVHKVVLELGSLVVIEVVVWPAYWCLCLEILLPRNWLVKYIGAYA
jgi:hypothetical protein